VQIAERVRRSECANLGHDARQKVEETGRLGDEPGERGSPVASFVGVRPFDQRATGGIAAVGRRQPGERQMEAALEMFARCFELCAPLLIDQP
jgi:hypothetical protein